MFYRLFLIFICYFDDEVKSAILRSNKSLSVSLSRLGSSMIFALFQRAEYHMQYALDSLCDSFPGNLSWTRIRNHREKSGGHSGASKKKESHV